MAYRTFSLYNIDASVGKGGSNAAEDVRIVQGLIAVMMSDSRMGPYMTKLFADKNLGKMPAVPSVNGVYSASLEAWIFAFQYMVQQKSSAAVADGRIDPLANLDGNSFTLDFKGRSGRQMTLAMLNKTALLFNVKGFLELAQKSGTAYWAELDGQSMIA